MFRTLNSTTIFSSTDITTEATVLAWSNPSKQPVMVRPVVILNDLANTAANITIRVMTEAKKNAFVETYNTGAVTKDLDANVNFMWVCPQPQFVGAAVGQDQIQIKVTSSNAGDTTVTGYVYLWNDSFADVYSLNTTVLSGSTTAVALNDGKAADDAYNNMFLAIRDADDDNIENRRITDYTGSNKICQLNKPLTFTPASGDEVYMFGCGGVDVNSVNDATPMSTSDIVTALQNVGTYLREIRTLLVAGGDGDITALKNTVDARTPTVIAREVARRIPRIAH